MLRSHVRNRMSMCNSRHQAEVAGNAPRICLSHQAWLPGARVPVGFYKHSGLPNTSCQDIALRDPVEPALSRPPVRQRVLHCRSCQLARPPGLRAGAQLRPCTLFTQNDKVLHRDEQHKRCRDGKQGDSQDIQLRQEKDRMRGSGLL